MKAKTIGIIGTRGRDSIQDFRKVKEKFMQIYKDGDAICSGLCSKGGDRFAVILADEINLPEEKRIWYPADWKRYGKGAGFVRNTYIARDSDVLIACVAADRKGGTEDTIKKFKKMGKEHRLIII